MLPCRDAVAKRSPILGYNHNVRFRGIVFHVQTEDSGIVNPHIFSHLFHGGVILSTRKLVYDPDSEEEVVKALMQSQHKAVLRDLRRGTFDDKIDLYLAGAPGLLPREAAGVAEVVPVAAPGVEAAAAEVEAASVEAAAAEIEAVAEAVADTDVTGPNPISIAALPRRFDDDLSAIPFEPIEQELSEPAIELIDSAELAASRTPTFQLVARPATLPMPALDLDAASFDSVTARSAPPAGTVDETDRVPVLPFPDSLDTVTLEPARPQRPEPQPLEPLLPEVHQPGQLEVDLDHVDLAAQARMDPFRVELPRGPDRIEPFRFGDPSADRAPTEVDSEPELLDLEPLLEPDDDEPPPIPVRIEPGRSGPMSPVRVSFVSARGPAPALEPVADAVPESLTYDRRHHQQYDVVALDAIETPPSGVSTFEDLMPAPLPPPPPLPHRGQAPGTTPPRGVTVPRPPRGANHETVPRLAGVPAPTPVSPHASPVIVGVPAPPPPPAFGPHANLQQPVTATMHRLPLHTRSIEDDDLHAAGLIESNEVAEIHAPPLPSATAPPGVQPERPGEYHVTRTRNEPPIVARPPTGTRSAMPPPSRPTPAAGRPVTPTTSTASATAGTFRGNAPSPAAAPSAQGRPGLPRAGTRPPVTAVPTPTRPDPSRPEPMAAPARPAQSLRPTPRSRPITGAGVVVSRPAVIVGAPTRSSNSPVSPVRPRRARDTGSDGLITERSLDEVILAYLSEDGHEE